MQISIWLHTKPCILLTDFACESDTKWMGSWRTGPSSYGKRRSTPCRSTSIRSINHMVSQTQSLLLRRTFYSTNCCLRNGVGNLYGSCEAVAQQISARTQQPNLTITSTYIEQLLFKMIPAYTNHRCVSSLHTVEPVIQKKMASVSAQIAHTAPLTSFPASAAMVSQRTTSIRARVDIIGAAHEFQL